MKRVLFVDDESNLLEGLRNLLRRHRHQMEMSFVSGGAAALEQLRKERFDVIVSDMRMPGMDGATLLQKVKGEFPAIIRIVLSANVEGRSFFKVLNVSHQCLAKPCNSEILFNVIERSCKLRDVLADASLRRKIGELEKLPSLPSAYRDLTEAISRPNVSASHIATIIQNDIAMSAKVLQMVNSAWFGSTKRVSQIEQAVVCLGMEMITNLVLTLPLSSILAREVPELSFISLQIHAIRTARVAKRLLPGESQGPQAFTAAFLHDIGRTILAICNPERYRVVIKTSQSSKRPLHEVETEMLGVTHEAVGAYLLNDWGLPFPIVEAVAYHHHPGSANERSFGVVSATALADSLLDSMTSNEKLVDMRHLENLNVLSELPRWTEIAKQELLGFTGTIS